MIDLAEHNRKWKALPDMREKRCNFNPCLFKEYVYLCGQGSKLMEAFSPQTESFLALQFQLPEDSACCLLVHNNLLVVHSSAYVSKFAAGQLVQSSQISSRHLEKLFNSPPVVNQGVFFICHMGKGFRNMGDVLCFNIETGSLVQRFR